MKYHVAIISHKRPQNVAKMQGLIDVPCMWYVGEGEGEEYLEAGAHDVFEGGGLTQSRNAALEHAFEFDLPCIQLSDDLKKLEFTADGKSKMAISFTDAVEMMQTELDKSPFKLIGIAPTPNAFYFHGALKLNAFVIGDFFMAKPSAVRFDEGMCLKEDYDFTAGHIKRYGGTLRLDGILATFAHYSNKGGAVDIRNPEREQAMIEHLMKKHPGMFRKNPRRENEILMVRPKGRFKFL